MAISKKQNHCYNTIIHCLLRECMRAEIKEKTALYFPYYSKCAVWKIQYSGWQIQHGGQSRVVLGDIPVFLAR